MGLLLFLTFVLRCDCLVPASVLETIEFVSGSVLIGLLLFVVAESMHVPDDVFVILFSNILAKRMSLCLLVQVAINWCSNVAQCNLYRCIEFPFCAPWARRGCGAMVQQV